MLTGQELPLEREQIGTSGSHLAPGTSKQERKNNSSEILEKLLAASVHNAEQDEPMV